ncbi:MAG TPA: hypothetical protein PK335_06310 [Draconibacterium sp.]|nr:hypothetical protein [Draconibacterium sp.]
MNKSDISTILLRNKLLTLIVPAITITYLLYLGWIDQTASLTRIDPEYVCLLNGLNVSLLKFHNIGFTDAPGTTFLILAGILIRISHFFFGNGAITDDVILRPDFYINSSSYILLLFTFILLIWGGLKVYKSTQSIIATFLLQSSLLLSPIALSLQIRFNIDRLIPLLTFVLAVYCILFIYEQITEKKFAIMAGIIIGAGLITKLNFIVLTIIPLFFFSSFRSWFIYIASFLGSAFISFLPIIDKYKTFTAFISRLFFYKGKYGGGEKGIFEFDAFLSALKKVPIVNESLIAIILLSILSIIIFFVFKSKLSRQKMKMRFLFGFLLAFIIIIILASKNFKYYYLSPVLGLSAIALLFSLDILTTSLVRNRFLKNSIILLVVGLLIIPTVSDVESRRKITIQRISDQKPMLDFVSKSISKSDFLLLEPAWAAGVLKENGLLYGISYVAGRNDFSKYYLEYYPNVLSFEGISKPFKHFRTMDADIKSIFTTENSLYLISTSGRNTKEVMQELRSQASFVKMKTVFDTVYINQNNSDKIIQANFIPFTDSIPIKTVSFFNDMEAERNNWKINSLSTEMAYSGSNSSMIKRGRKYSTVCEIDSLQSFISSIHALTISCKYFQPNDKNNAQLVIQIFNNKNEQLWYPVFCINYFEQIKQWANFSYNIYIPDNYRKAQKANVYFYNSSKSPVFIDDFKVKLSYYE